MIVCDGRSSIGDVQGLPADHRKRPRAGAIVTSTRIESNIGTAPWPSAARHDALAFVGGLLVPIAVFSLLAVLGENGWDRAAIRWAERHYTPPIATPLEEALKVSMVVGVAIAIGSVILFGAMKRWRLALFWFLAIAGALALEPPLKEIFRWAPVGDTAGYSFPSGNAILSVAILAAGALTWPARWRRATLAVGIPIVIAYGAALVVQLWHYPSDVVAGWCVALSWVTAVWLVFRRAASRARLRFRSHTDPLDNGPDCAQPSQSCAEGPHAAAPSAPSR